MTTETTRPWVLNLPRVNRPYPSLREVMGPFHPEIELNIETTTIVAREPLRATWSLEAEQELRAWYMNTWTFGDETNPRCHKDKVDWKKEGF